MAQMLTGSAIRLIITVATLAAVYFFIVRPVLDTTNSALEQGFNVTQQINESIADSFDNAGLEDFEVPNQQKQANKMLNCVEKAGQDVNKLHACAMKFSP